MTAAQAFAPPHATSEAERSLSEAADAGVLWQTVDDVPYDGRSVQIDGQTLLNFGSCSYLGLDRRRELQRGAIEAIERFGTQFSYSRAYLQLPLYKQLEEALEAMTGGHALVAASTTLAHIAALPALITVGDAAIIDKSAHASLHTAVGLLRSIPVHAVRHNRLDLLELEIARLSGNHRRVWFVLDGLYSMLGDFAPFDSISALLEKYPRLHLYVDDAHSTSWTGRNGRGRALDCLPDLSRVVVALSLNKAFSAGGGALIFASHEDRQKVRRSGGPMVFSGPLQPPLLGAALASARLHLDPSFPALQKSLVARIDRTLALAEELGVPLVAHDQTPIFFVRCGASKVACDLALALRQRDLYVNVSVFPAVPHNHAGVRFTLSLSNTLADIDHLMTALSEEGQRLGVGGSSATVRSAEAAEGQRG